jgi:hypothetical protein
MRPTVGYLGSIGVSLALFLAAFGSTASGQNNPLPLLNQPLVPTTAAPGGPSFTLTVNGTGFVSGATVQWNGAALATHFASASQLTATVPASDVATAGTAVIAVANLAPGGVSNPQLFSVTSPRPAIALAPLAGIGAGADPASVAVADFNGDGKPDLAVVNVQSNTVSILLGNGNGTFQPQMTFATGSLPYFAAAADVNHDGKVDLAVNNAGDNTVSILLGNGDGTFQPHVDYVVGAQGNNQMSLAIADFNRDGNLDLAVCNPFSGSVSILLGNGDGTFQPQMPTPISTPYSLAAGDFNGDGILDLAVAADGIVVSILLGNGDGTFTTGSSLPAANASEIVSADVNADGKLDLAFIRPTQGQPVYVALGNGDGTFQSPVGYSVNSAGGNSLAVADFNGDGKLDLAVNTGNAISTLMGNGDGTFQTFVDQPASSLGTSIAAADLNGDGLMDAATTRLVFLATVAEFSTYSVDFGSVAVGVTSPPQIVTLFNAGSSALTISSVASGGPFAETNNCGSSLAAGARCTFNVTFTPTGVGNETGSLTVTDSALGSPQSVSLSGVGQAPAVSLSPTGLLFADQKVGTQSSVQRVTLTNTGNLTLTLSSISISGQFRERNNCGTSLAAGVSCTIAVVFKPTVSGTNTGAITVSDNAAGNPQTISLTGTGIFFELSPTFLNFGNVVVGQTPSQNVTLTNSSNNAQTVGGIRLTGNHLGEFTETNNCGTSLGAGATCTITVTFAPTKTGSSNASLEVSGGGANQTVSISGVGTE